MPQTPYWKDGHPMTDRTNSDAQMRSSTYTLPALDQEFLLGDSTRGIRFMLEYMKAEEHLRNWGVRTTIVAFGSARVKEDDAGRRGLDQDGCLYLVGFRLRAVYAWRFLCANVVARKLQDLKSPDFHSETREPFRGAQPIRHPGSGHD